MVGEGLTLAVAMVLITIRENCYLESFWLDGIGVVWRRSEGLVKRLYGRKHDDVRVDAACVILRAN